MKNFIKNIKNFPIRATIIPGILLFVLIFFSCSDLPTSPSEMNKSALSKPVITFSNGISQGSYINEVNGVEALYKITIPPSWNEDVVVYAHGFIPPQEELRIQDDVIEGVPVSAIVNSMGFAFVTTSYATNGILPPEIGITDLDSVVNIFHRLVNQYLPENMVNNIYLVGASEGGWLTALAIEGRPDLFSGGLSLCGPVGDFQKQLNYFGDFRAVFDYFFAKKIENWSPWTQDNPEIPQQIIDNWTTVYKPAIEQAVVKFPFLTKQLLQVTKVPVEYSDPLAPLAVTSLLRYNITTINDILENKFDGLPYRNIGKWYFGSKNDFRLNRKIERFTGNYTALQEIKNEYQTSGDLSIPIVTIHTFKDEIVPYWHEPLYRKKVLLHGSSLYHTNFPVFRYGHCNFTQEEVLRAFQWLIFKVNVQNLFFAEAIEPPQDF